LGVEPKVSGIAEDTAKDESGIRGDGPAVSTEFIHMLSGQTGSSGELCLSDAEWLQELFNEHLTGGNGLAFCGQHAYSAPSSVRMIIEIYLMCAVLMPSEDEPPLCVDPNGTPSLQPASQLFVVVAGRNPEICFGCRVVEKLQFSKESVSQIGRNLFRMTVFLEVRA
jgi:hypothetical protein